jgi:ABC-type oligopeptide transport system substrate-binding subunit
MRSTIGAALLLLLAALVVAGGAAAHSQKTGGTLNVDLTTDLDYTDPALSYLSTGWELEYATCLKLVNYPDANGPNFINLLLDGRNIQDQNNNNFSYFNVRSTTRRC